MINMPHQIMINSAPEKVYEAITTTEGIKGWWSTDILKHYVEGKDPGAWHQT
jgi:uncharacterized protein YndB with AHSA1/START domain